MVLHLNNDFNKSLKQMFVLQDYEKIAPPNSFIHADDFNTPEVSFLIRSTDFLQK